MKVDTPTGKYVIAVSGGVDSMVLLDILKKQNRVDLVIAHFNHGIREDANQDEELVLGTARKQDLPIEVGYGKLGKHTSEEKAREVRYQFLNSVRDKYQAKGLITAHHQDDLIETAFINIIRGTGHRGLASMIANPNVVRPLLNIPKKDLLKYAKENNIIWREDTTNADTTYLRNYLRKEVLFALTDQERHEIVKNIEKVANNSVEMNELIAIISHNVASNGIIDRTKFALLPVEIANELTMHLLRTYSSIELDRKLVERFGITVRTALPGTKHPLKGAANLVIKNKTAQIITS